MQTSFTAKHSPSLPFQAGLGAFTALTLIIWAMPAVAEDVPGVEQTKAPTPFAELAAKAGAQYQGNGLSVLPAPEGARLRCVFQKLEGQATPDGLWLVSTADGVKGDRFRIVARSVGREYTSSTGGRHSVRAAALQDDEDAHRVTRPTTPLARTGTVAVAEKVARFVRPGLVEEYSVSMDGVRQDFLVLQRPGGEGKLRVELDVTGAKAEALVTGARLALDGSGRKVAYNRLLVADAQGHELAARMEVASDHRLAVLVDDAGAVYPVRIDPTFSDANWASMGGLPGANGSVLTAIVDGSGNLYIGGDFTLVGEVAANLVAKWDGTAWSAMGSGLPIYRSGPWVNALAVSGTNLYVGGYFRTAGGSPATNIARWNGSTWSALGSGLNGAVYALAVSGTNLYVGGYFTIAGGSPADYIAKWDGSTWSGLGSQLTGYVYALAVAGTDLYVGGQFTVAGGSAANYIAKWNGSTWSALGTGLNGTFYPQVVALAASGTDLYVGGYFTAAGGSPATNIARWNGSTWSALGSGLDGSVSALAFLGTDLYVGGQFTVAGGSAATNIAKWDGSAWSALGSGCDNAVRALAVSGGDLYVGGNFLTAGGRVSAYLARANLADNTAPTLTIGRSGKNAVVSWPSPSSGFALEQNFMLGTANWTNIPATPSDDGTNKTVAIPLDSASSFFRLKK